MNPAIERQLAQVRARYARTPLPRFFSWWGRELLACLPAQWRALFEERPECLLVEPADDALVVWREHAGEVREHARVERTLAPEAQRAELVRLRGASAEPDARMLLCIDSDRVLHRHLSLPAAAAENLRQVLTFEMDRQTPFKADQVYFDARADGHANGQRNFGVDLVLIPRAQLDPELALLAGPGGVLDGVDSWRGEAGGSRWQMNLLPQDRRARRRDMRLPIIVGLAVLALILLFVNMNESLANRAAALASMQAEVTAAETQAKQVAALRKSLDDSVDGANFLTEKKRKGPLEVALLEDLSKHLPDDTYLERLQVDNGKVQLQGQAGEAAKLIGLLGSAACLSDPSFQGQIQPDPRTGKERFQIDANIKPCGPADVGGKTTSSAKPAAAPAEATKPPAPAKVPAKAPGKAPVKPMPPTKAPAGHGVGKISPMPPVPARRSPPGSPKGSLAAPRPTGKSDGH